MFGHNICTAAVKFNNIEIIQAKHLSVKWYLKKNIYLASYIATEITFYLYNNSVGCR